MNGSSGQTGMSAPLLAEEHEMLIGQMSWRTAVLVAGVTLGVAGAAGAQPKPGGAGDGSGRGSGKVRTIDNVGTTELLNRFASEDAEVRKGAIEHFKERIASQPARVLDLRAQAFKALQTGKHFDEAIDLAWYGTVTVPHDTRALEGFAQARVRALLAAGKADEALQAAKSLFNVSTMQGTSEAILLVAETLNAARPKDKESFNKFREEQMAGAAAPAGEGGAPESVRTAKGARSTVLESIKVDPAKYEAALSKMTGEDYQSLMGRGNLLLMADRVAEAREVFERMYSLATASELVEASEALARTIRAEDGTIGRANAWVSAIKPKPAVAPVAPAPAPVK